MIHHGNKFVLGVVQPYCGLQLQAHPELGNHLPRDNFQRIQNLKLVQYALTLFLIVGKRGRNHDLSIGLINPRYTRIRTDVFPGQ